jgi:hypothetical protein
MQQRFLFFLLDPDDHTIISRELDQKNDVASTYTTARHARVCLHQHAHYSTTSINVL